MKNVELKNNFLERFFWNNLNISNKIKFNKIIPSLLIIFLFFCHAKSFAQFGGDCICSNRVIAKNDNGYLILYRFGNSSDCNHIWELNSKNQFYPYIKRFQNGDIEVNTITYGTSLNYEGISYRYSKRPFIEVGNEKKPGLEIKDSREYSKGIYKVITYVDGTKTTNSDFNKGTPRSIQKEPYTESINDIIESAIKETRQNIVGFSNETYALSEKINMGLFVDNIKKEYNKALVTLIEENKQKISLTKEELDYLYTALQMAERGGYFDEVISIYNILIAKSPKGYEDIIKMDRPTLYTSFRGHFYEKNNKFELAIIDYKKCLASVNDPDKKTDLTFNISQCYEKLGDKKNAALYWSLVKDKMDNDIENRSTIESKQSAKKFCIRTTNSMYELTFFEGGANAIAYKLYNNQGNVLKTTAGKWKMQDEGVYGSAYKIRISWSGANTNMPELVFLCQFDAFGSIQGIIDSENRTWQICN